MEVRRYVRSEPQNIPCIGGHKYFYLDWDLNIWRCEAWHEPLGSVFDLDTIPDQREPCNACMMGCYRNASMLMHAPIAAVDAGRALSAGRMKTAIALLFRRSVAQSLGAMIAEIPRIVVRKRRRRVARTPGGFRVSTGL